MALGQWHSRKNPLGLERGFRFLDQDTYYANTDDKVLMDQWTNELAYNLNAVTKRSGFWCRPTRENCLAKAVMHS